MKTGKSKAKRLFNRYYGYEERQPHSLLEISEITGYSMFHLERFYNHLIKYKYRTRTYKFAYAMGTIYSACVPFHINRERYGYFLRRKKPVKWGKNKR
tara:strand:- start:859 stop:1152 length:294 start_codon:yes stop_codon:yes gene_type:complete